MCKIEPVNEQVLDTERQGRKDLQWALNLNYLSLRILGVMPGEHEFHGLRGTLIFLWVPFMITLTFFSIVLPQMYAIYMVIHELPLIIDNIMTNTVISSSICKLYFLWRNKEVLGPVIQSINQDWLQAKPTWERELMIRKASGVRLCTIFGFMFVAGCYLGFCTAPLLGLSVRIINNITDYGERTLIMQTYFPYDYSKSPNYEITMSIHIFGGLIVLLGVSVPDLYFAALVFHISAQFEILGEHLRNSIEKKGEGSSQMRTHIERHVHLMRLVSLIDCSFSDILFVQIVNLSVMGCCFGVEIISTLDPSTDSEASFIQLGTLFGTLFTFMLYFLGNCLVAEELAEKSSGIFNEIYNSKWYAALETKRSQDLIPIMAASKNPRQISAGKVFVMSLMTFTKILKSTGGYISMLMAVQRRSSSISLGF